MAHFALCQARHDRAGLGPTEPCTGCDRALLSSGCQWGEYYRVAHGTGPAPTETQSPRRTPVACPVWTGSVTRAVQCGSAPWHCAAAVQRGAMQRQYRERKRGSGARHSDTAQSGSGAGAVVECHGHYVVASGAAPPPTAPPIPPAPTPAPPPPPPSPALALALCRPRTCSPQTSCFALSYSLTWSMRPSVSAMGTTMGCGWYP